MTATLLHGDCIEQMGMLADASVDSIVTDPPYHLTQNSRGGHARTNNPAMPHGRHRIGDKGFMGKVWDGGDVAFRVETWAEALRVLKPGGHLLAFGGTRTQHRMVCAIEDAGFEIRDQIGWAYGSGFPKSKNLDGDWEGWGTALKPAWEPIIVARKPLVGTVAKNVLVHGTGALNIDGCRVPAGGEQPKGSGARESWRAMEGRTDLQPHDENVTPEAGRWPANIIHDGSDEVLAAFPPAPGQQGKVTGSEPTANGFSGAVKFGGMIGRIESCSPRVEVDTSAARFFYCAKASAADRHDGLENPGKQFAKDRTPRDAEKVEANRKGNHHPTVKPTELMRYLCRLVTPPQGVVLDLFMGSGSTGRGAVLEGFNFIGIERDAEYVSISRARIASAEAAYAHRQRELMAKASEQVNLELFAGVSA